MKRAYVVTEGKTDVAILKSLLPPNLVDQTGFVAGSGSYSAQTLAQSLLVAKQRPVALVVDADTEDVLSVQEKKDFLHEALNQVSPGVPFGVFVAVPEMEIVFFQEKPLLEKALHQSFSPLEWEMSKSGPKKFLKLNNQDSETLLPTLDPQTLGTLRQHPLIRDLSQFLASVMNGV